MKCMVARMEVYCRSVKLISGGRAVNSRKTISFPKNSVTKYLDKKSEQIEVSSVYTNYIPSKNTKGNHPSEKRSFSSFR